MRIKTLVIDTNIWLKLPVNEDDSDLVMELFENIRDEGLIIKAPQFLKVEFGSVINKKVSLKLLSLDQGMESLVFLEDMGCMYIDEDWDLLKKSIVLAQKINQMTIYDCIFVELAKREKADFISEDTKFLKQAKKVYKNCFNIEEYLKKLENK